MAKNDIAPPDFSPSAKLAIDPAERPAIVLEDYVYNFAFGSNIGLEKLKSRAGGIAVESCEPGLVRGHRLAFNLPAIPPLEPTMAGIEPKEGSVCHGSLYKLKRDQYEKLYISEGGLAGKARPYLEHQVTVEKYNGEKVEAVAFRTNTHSAVPGWAELPPSKRYLDLITAGAESQQLDPTYIEWLEKLPRAPPCNAFVRWYARFFSVLYFVWLVRKLPGAQAMGVYKGAIFYLFAYAEWCKQQAEPKLVYLVLHVLSLCAAYLAMLPGVVIGMCLMALKAALGRLAALRKRLLVAAVAESDTAKSSQMRGSFPWEGSSKEATLSSRASKKEE